MVLTSSLALRRMNDHMDRQRKEDKLLTRMTDGEKEEEDTSWLKPVTCSAAWELFTFLWHLRLKAMHAISLQQLITDG